MIAIKEIQMAAIQLVGGNVENKKGYNTVYRIIAPIRSLRFIY